MSAPAFLTVDCKNAKKSHSLKTYSIFWFSFTKKNLNVVFPRMQHTFSVLEKNSEMEKEKRGRGRERERRMGAYLTF